MGRDMGPILEEIRQLKEERDSWRRVAERLESEKKQAERDAKEFELMYKDRLRERNQLEIEKAKAKHDLKDTVETVKRNAEVFLNQLEDEKRGRLQAEQERDARYEFDKQRTIRLEEERNALLEGLKQTEKLSLDAGVTLYPQQALNRIYEIARSIIAKIEGHQSDCSVHNEPAYPKGECDCDGGDRARSLIAKIEQKENRP